MVSYRPRWSAIYSFFLFLRCSDAKSRDGPNSRSHSNASAKRRRGVPDWNLAIVSEGKSIPSELARVSVGSCRF